MSKRDKGFRPARPGCLVTLALAFTWIWCPAMALMPPATWPASHRVLVARKTRIDHRHRRVDSRPSGNSTSTGVPMRIASGRSVYTQNAAAGPNGSVPWPVR